MAGCFWVRAGQAINLDADCFFYERTRRMKKLILAVVYSDGLAADQFLSRLGYMLRDFGVNVGGLVQRNTFVRDRTKCDMELEELLSGEVFQISEDRGRLATGCRLDRGVLAQASATMGRVVDERPAVLILNKFGKVEAEGGGLRDTIVSAAQSGIPVIVGVPFRNIDQWRAFAGELADEADLSAEVVARWLKRVGLKAHGHDRNMLGQQGPDALDKSELSYLSSLIG
jgi:hypothetical protein